jgi:cytochrome c-type protein NapB
MKITKKAVLGLLALSVLTVGCATNDTVSEESLGLRKTDLYSETSETVGHMTKYGSTPAGSSKKFARAYQDAPPMIPHSVEGMLPITINNNQCKTCHVDSAPYDKTIPSVPPSHFTNFRPASYAISGTNTSSEDLSHVSIKKENKLVGARFNCSQCHAPQAEGLAVENSFKAKYTKKDGATKSSWDDKEFMKGIKTIK